MKIKKIDINSILPIIINKIKLIFEDVNRLEKFILFISNISEFKVLVKVNIDNLKDFSNPILSITNKLDKIKRLRKKEMNIRNDIFTFSSVIFFSELNFSSNAEETKEFIILFSPTKDLNSYRTFLLPFDQKEIPWGSYKLFSQFNETLYVAVGTKKFSLEPGKSIILDSKDFDGRSRERMIIYRKEKGNYIESASQSFGINDRQRGIFFVTVKKGKAQIVPMVESKRPIDQAIGYNTKPKEMEVEGEEIKSLVPVGNF